MNIIYKKEIPVRHEVDVFIAGGGPAGVAAAVMASREGSKVFLAEQQGAFGGTGTLGLVPAYMEFGNHVDFLAGGIGYEIATTLYGKHDVGYFSRNLSIDVEKLKRVYDDMCIKSGVQFSFFTSLIDVSASDGTIDHVILNGKSGTFAVKAKVYVDCSGDGDLCAWAGADYEVGDNGKCMPATLCSLWADINWEAKDRPDNSELERAIADGVFLYEDRHLPGMWQLSKTTGGGNIGHTFNTDATDERSLTEAMVRGRQYMLEYDRYYREYLNGYENMQLMQTGSILGVRESRRIMGDYILNEKDFINRADFNDEIGRYSYPVDIHIMEPTKDAYEKFYKEHISMRYDKGESYGIPYRSLIPRKLGNVLVGGRCISTDRAMQSSIRVMPGCYITGQACGMAAALASNNGGDVRKVNVEELQSKLKAAGAYLPRI